MNQPAASSPDDDSLTWPPAAPSPPDFSSRAIEDDPPVVRPRFQFTLLHLFGLTTLASGLAACAALVLDDVELGEWLRLAAWMALLTGLPTAAGLSLVLWARWRLYAKLGGAAAIVEVIGGMSLVLFGMLFFYALIFLLLVLASGVTKAVFV